MLITATFSSPFFFLFHVFSSLFFLFAAMLFWVPIVCQALREVNSIYDLIYSPINKPHDGGGIVSFLIDKELSSELWSDLFKVTQLVSDRVGIETEACWHQHKCWSTMLSCPGLWDWEMASAKEQDQEPRPEYTTWVPLPRGTYFYFPSYFIFMPRPGTWLSLLLVKSPLSHILLSASSSQSPTHYGQAHPLLQNHPRHVQLLDPI